MRARLDGTAQLHNTEPHNLETADENGKEMDMIIDYEPPIEDPISHDDRTSPSNTPAAPIDQRARVEDVDDNEDNSCERWIEDFPQPVGVPIRPAKSYFETVRDNQKQHGEEPWAPFQDIEEWELAQFLMLNLGQNAMDKYLKLPIVSDLFILNHRIKANQTMTLRPIIE